jgi:hypothetical protein
MMTLASSISGTREVGASLTDDGRVVVYNCNMFKIQAIELRRVGPHSSAFIINIITAVINYEI